MLWTLAVVCALTWLIALIASATMGGIIHVLLVLAFVLGYIAWSRARSEQAHRRAAARHHDDPIGRKSYHFGDRK